MTLTRHAEEDLNVFRLQCQQEGWHPLTWDEVTQEVRTRLEARTFTDFERLHRSFTAYPTFRTLEKFYGFCYSSKLGDLLVGYRFHRLTRLLFWLHRNMSKGERVLDIGSGTGTVARWLRNHKSPAEIAAVDRVPEAEGLWSQWARPPLPDETFSLLLCFDSLGEVNSDDDDALQAHSPSDLPGLFAQIENRYGFTAKLEPWLSRLQPGGCIWLSEPIADEKFWQAMHWGWSQKGWICTLFPLAKQAGDPDGYLLEIRLEYDKK